jgi:hypothetical protein
LFKKHILRNICFCEHYYGVNHPLLGDMGIKKKSA